MKIEDIQKDGFYSQDVGSKHEDIAFITLRLSIRAYLRTYKDLNYRISEVVELKELDKDVRSTYRINYIESASESILHFQHFIELIIKSILRDKHPLLAVDAGREPGILFDLLQKKEVSEEDMQKTRALDFSDSLKRLVALIKKDEQANSEILFFKESQKFLEILGGLRNRILHRGVFTLNYKAFDGLFAGFAFPLMYKIIGMEKYSSWDRWPDKENKSNIKPILEIVQSYKQKYDPYKIAVLKEIGRAAYESPILRPGDPKRAFEYVNKEFKENSTMVAVQVLQNEFHYAIKDCPVCGVNSLVIMDDMIDIEDDNGTTHVDRFVYKIKCYCCLFELSNESYNIGKMGLPLEDYFSLE